MTEINDIIYLANQLKKGEKKTLSGFDPKYANICDYIIDITYDIWENKGIGVLYETYDKDISMHVGLQTICGRDEVISGTLDTLQTFRDRAPFGEEVIWSEAKNDSYFSSHRLGSTATHSAPSLMYGEPTGRKFFYRVMADCLIKDNRIVEEWLVRDSYHMYLAIGKDPIAMAKASGRYREKPEGEDFRRLKKENSIGSLSIQHTPLLKTETSVNLIVQLYQSLYKQNYFDKVSTFYHRMALLHSICESRYNGHKGIKDFYINFFSSVPNSNIIIDRITCNKGIYMDKVAVRWKIDGIHKNYGEFGEPSGKEIQITGITHYEIVAGKILQEWVVFDKFDVLCQIYRDA